MSGWWRLCTQWGLDLPRCGVYLIWHWLPVSVAAEHNIESNTVSKLKTHSDHYEALLAPNQSHKTSSLLCNKTLLMTVERGMLKIAHWWQWVWVSTPLQFSAHLFIITGIILSSAEAYTSMNYLLLTIPRWGKGSGNLRFGAERITSQRRLPAW